jgi:hypothetical protein
MKLSHVTAAVALMVTMTVAPQQASAAVDTYLQLRGHPVTDQVRAFGISQMISIMAAML